MTTKTPDVVILGAGFAGLCAAAALRKHYDKILLIDRDPIEFGGDRPRPNTPQASHGHNLLTHGYRLISQLFPEWEVAIEGRNVPHLDWGQDVELFGSKGWHFRSPSEFRTRSLSRTLLESTLRRVCLTWPEIEIRQDTWTNLIFDTGRSRVTGVQLSAGQVVSDRVIDASGRSSRLAAALKDLELGSVEVTSVDPKVTYASAIVRLAAEPGSHMVFITPSLKMEQLSAGMLVRIEDGLWMITLVGIGTVPPTDRGAFTEYAKHLRSQRIYELLKQATFESPVTLYGNTANRRRSYHTLSGFPDGLLVMGDALVAFNPLYGQGMTVVARQACELGNIASRRRKFDRNLQMAIARTCDDVWSATIARDKVLMRNQGPREPVKTPRRRVSFSQKILSKIAAGASDSALLRDAYLGLAHLTRTPIEILRPRLLWEIWRRPS